MQIIYAPLLVFTVAVDFSGIPVGGLSSRVWSSMGL